MSEIENAITENATGPKKVSGDAGSVEQHSLKDQIAADKYLASKKAAGREKDKLVLPVLSTALKTLQEQG